MPLGIDNRLVRLLSVGASVKGRRNVGAEDRQFL